MSQITPLRMLWSRRVAESPVANLTADKARELIPGSGYTPNNYCLLSSDYQGGKISGTGGGAFLRGRDTLPPQPFKN